MGGFGILRIAKNTIILYVRLLFIILLSFLTTSITLRLLGIQDYGIYEIVAGIVLLLSSVNALISSALRRYYAYYLGLNQIENLRKVFSISIFIFIIFSILVVVIGETIGLWVVNNVLDIPKERLVAANWIYQFAILSFILSVLTIPFSSAVVAHEDMSLFAYISVFEYLIRLVFIILLKYIFLDKLIVYGFVLFMTYFIVLFLYFYIGRRRYKECHYIKVNDKPFYKDFLSFSGWTMLGTVSSVFNNYGNNLLLNVFFGTLVNAARAIAMQVSNTLNVFSNNFFSAVSPPLTKSYAEKDFDKTLVIFYFSNKFVFYLLFLLFLPLFLETRYLLTLWLGNITEEMVIFTKLSLVYSLVLSLCNPITILIQATGKVKWYSILVETVTLLSLPITFLLFKMGTLPVATFWVTLIVFSFAHIIRLFVLQYTVPFFRVADYFARFGINALIIGIVSICVTYSVRCFLAEDIVRLLLLIILSTITILFLGYIIGLSKEEKYALNNIIKNFVVHKATQKNG